MVLIGEEKVFQDNKGTSKVQFTGGLKKMISQPIKGV
jgi:hypothetical protein